MALFGSTYVAGTLPLIILSALLVPLTYLVTLGAVGIPMGGDRGRRPGDLRRAAADHVSEHRQLRRVRRHRRRIAVLLDARRDAQRGPDPGWWRPARSPDWRRWRASTACSSPWQWRPPGSSAAAGHHGEALRPAGRSLAWGVASAAAFLLVLAPWLIRNATVFGSPLPSAGGHTLWITSYNEQFSIGHEVSLATYLDWGLREHHPVEAQLVGRARRPHGRAAGRHLPHLLRRRALDLPATRGAGSLLRVLRGHVLRDGRAFHLPCAERRLLPLRTGMAAVGPGDLRGCGRSGVNRRRPGLAIPPTARHASVRCGRGPWRAPPFCR